LDESDDRGFKLNGGSSPFLVVTMVIFAIRDTALSTEQVIRDAKTQLRVEKEFKPIGGARGFFKAIAGVAFESAASSQTKRLSIAQPMQ
jgi:hypothetical protein